MQKTKRNFRINVILIISAVIVFTLFAFCSYLDYRSNYLVGSNFSYNTYQSNKYPVKNSDFNYKEGTIIPVTNHNEYNQVINHYDIQVTNKLSKQDIKNNNYLYLIIGETPCIDNINYEYYIINNNIIEIYLSTNNCTCQVSKTTTYAYEIPYPENIPANATFTINFLDTNNQDKSICETM